MPAWVLVIDYVLGAVMWTLIGRAALGMFLPPDSPWGFMRILVRITDPLIRLFAPVTPGFLVAPMVPLFVAWFFFLLRFYILPPLLGFGVMGVLSFPLESDIAQTIARLLG